MDTKALSKQVSEIIEPIVAEEGLELWDVEFLVEEGRRVLRVMVERPAEGTVTVEECTRVSHSIEDILEVKDVVAGRYDLQVSSPGLDRPLKTKPQFARYIGRMVRLKTSQPLEGRRNYKGQLMRIEGESFVVKVDHLEFQIPFAEVEKANLEFEIVKGKKL